MPIDAVRHVSPQELAAFRSRRRAGQWGGYTASGSLAPDGVEVHRAERGDDGAAYVSRPARPGVKREARDVRDAITDRRLASILARRDDPEFVQRLARAFREKSPELGKHMSDEEIVRATVAASSKEATERAFKKIGRGVHNGNA